MDRARNGAEIISKARNDQCVHIPQKKVSACGEDATHFYVFEKKWPVCFCDKHDGEKFGEDRYLTADGLESCTKDEFDAAIFLAF